MSERIGSSANAVAARAEIAARLLVLDDEVGVRDTLGAVLRREGYEVLTGGRLNEVATLLRDAPVDVVLLDLRVSDADGRDPLVELGALAPGALVIVLTGYATLESALRALHAGAYAYLVKPTDIEELRLTVERALERRRLERELAARVVQLEAANAAISDFNTQLRTQVETATSALERKIEALDDANRQLMATQEQHERFVAMVAHELRGPLGLVMSYAQLAARPGNSIESLGRYTDAIIEHSSRLNRLVEDLQTATRLSTGQFTLRREPCDLVRDVGATVEQFRTTVSARRFTFDGQSDLGQVEVDRDRVLQALRNLLDNAVKYSVENGAIEVRVWSAEHRICISVRDEGAGIPENEMQDILRPFVRGTSGREVPGSGLGLYITRGIIEAHGGELVVQNGSGPERARGALFTLVLPRGAAEVSSARHS
jgi:signal transduction histidine kinase